MMARLYQDICLTPAREIFFEKNAKVMNVDLSLIDSVIISHGHYDHAGGLDHFLRINYKGHTLHKRDCSKTQIQRG